MDDEVRTIDATPTWSAILPVLVGVLQNPEAPVSAHKQAMAELQRMAQLADALVAAHDPDDRGGLTAVLGDPDIDTKES